MRKKLLLGALFVVLITNAKADVIINSNYINNEIIKGELIGLGVCRKC